MKRHIHRYLLASASLVAGLTCLTARVEAAISVGPSGTGTNTFDATPAATEWSTLNIAGGGGDLTTAADMDTYVITNTSAASITTVLGTSSTRPLSANAIARRNTAANWLQTCPTSVKYNVLMATLQNSSGADLVGLDVSYDLGNELAAGTTLVEEIPGHRVFYSQTGAAGSWTLAAALSGGTEGKVSGTLSLGTWAKGALLYILWVDDNAAANRDNAGDEEGGYTIDNWVAVGVAPKKVVTFQQGVDGYTGAVDTEIRGGATVSDTEFSTVTVLNPDGSDQGGEVHSLLRFDNLFGPGAGQIPTGKAILKATLTLDISDAGSLVNIHRMKKAWAATVTWNLFDPTSLDGVLSGTYGARAADDTEAVFTPDAAFTAAALGALEIEIPVATIQAWSDGSAPNYGWAILPTGTDGVDFSSSDIGTASTRPKLTVTWGEPGEPTVQGIVGSPTGFKISLEDGKGVGAKPVDQATIKVKLDGVDVTSTCTITKSNTATTVKYVAPAWFAPLSDHVASIAFSDTSVPPRPQAQDLPFQVVYYNILPPQFALNVGDIATNKPGFMWTVHQNALLTADNNQRPLDQLDGKLIDPGTGEPYVNEADPNFQGVALAPATPAVPAWAPLKFEITNVINLSQTAGENNRYFPNDEAMPGIAYDLNGIAGELITYLELPAGMYMMGVSSDDGSRTTAGNFRDALQGMMVGEHVSSGEVIFSFGVTQAGYYGFRTVWEEATGGANIEWFTVKEDGTKVLVNDLANGGLKAYRAATAPMAPYVKSVSPEPVPRMANVPSSTLSVTLADGTNPVDANSVKLTLDGNLLSLPTLRTGSTVTVTYYPTNLQVPGIAHTAKIEFKDSTGSYSRSQEWKFYNLKNIILPAPAILETFDSTPEGQVPTGWTRWNFTDCSGTFCATPGLDLNDLDSDSYKDFVVVSDTTLQPLKSMAFNVRPGQFTNGVEVTALISGNLVYAESDVRDGDQVQYLTTPAYNLSAFTKDAVLSFHNIYEQNQDNIGVVEYSIDDGTNWLPVAYYLDMLDGGGDIKLNPDGSVNAVKTLTDPNADTASWIEGGVTKGDTYGAFVAAPITDALGPYIEPRRNDDNFDGQRVEVYYLPGAAKQSKVRFRFAQGGTGSWYFGIENLGLYDVQVPRPLPVPPRFNPPTLQGGNMSLSWTGSATLQQAVVVTGPYTNAPSQSNPQTVPATGPAMFYRLK